MKWAALNGLEYKSAAVDLENDGIMVYAKGEKEESVLAKHVIGDKECQNSI